MSFADNIASLRAHTADDSLFKQRRTQIVTSAVQLFSDQGYYKTTVQDVARHIGISPGLIYQYVRDKEELLLLSILDVLDSYAHEIPVAIKGLLDPLQQYCAAFRSYCRVVNTRRDATILAYRSTKSLSNEKRKKIMEAETETNKLIENCIQACIDAGLFRDVDSEVATYQLVMYAHAWALKHWQLSKHFNIDSYIREGLDYSLHALLTEKGWEHYKNQ